MEAIIARFGPRMVNASCSYRGGKPGSVSSGSAQTAELLQLFNPDLAPSLAVTFGLFLAVGFFAQLVDGAVGMAYGVISSSVLLAFGVSRPPGSTRGSSASGREPGIGWPAIWSGSV